MTLSPILGSVYEAGKGEAEAAGALEQDKDLPVCCENTQLPWAPLWGFRICCKDSQNCCCRVLHSGYPKAELQLLLAELALQGLRGQKAEGEKGVRSAAAARAPKAAQGQHWDRARLPELLGTWSWGGSRAWAASGTSAAVCAAAALFFF